MLLNDRHRLEGQLDAQVTSGDHDAVEGVDDLLQVVDRLRLLDLGDHRDLASLLGHDLVHAVDVLRVTHERQRDVVSPQLEAPAQICLVLLGQRRNVHGDTREVDPLVVGHRTGNDDLGSDAHSVGVEDLDLDFAVIDEEEVPGRDILRQSLECGADNILRADDVFRGDGENVADSQFVRPRLELAESDLRPLQIDEHRDRLAGVFGGLAHVGVNLVVHLVTAVAEVHPRDVHAGLDDGADVLVAGRCRPESCDDFCSSHDFLRCGGWEGRARWQDASED